MPFDPLKYWDDRSAFRPVDQISHRRHMRCGTGTDLSCRRGVAAGRQGSCFRTADLMSAAVVAGLSTLAALAIAAFWILPAMRRQSQEQGELKSLTGRLEQRSQDLEHAAVTDPPNRPAQSTVLRRSGASLSAGLRSDRPPTRLCGARSRPFQIHQRQLWP